MTAEKSMKRTLAAIDQVAARLGMRTRIQLPMPAETANELFISPMAWIASGILAASSCRSASPPQVHSAPVVQAVADEGPHHALPKGLAGIKLGASVDEVMAIAPSSVQCSWPALRYVEEGRIFTLYFSNTTEIRFLSETDRVSLTAVTEELDNRSIYLLPERLAGTVMGDVAAYLIR